MTQLVLPLADRLKTQADRVRFVMSDGGWYSLEEIKLACRELGHWDSEAAISARIREDGNYDPAKDKRRRGGSGNLFEYRLGRNL